MNQRDEALLAEWQLKRSMGIPAEKRLNDNKPDLLEATLRKIEEVIGEK